MMKERGVKKNKDKINRKKYIKIDIKIKNVKLVERRAKVVKV